MNTRTRAILALFLASFFVLNLIPQEASAFPYRLRGYLRDGDGNPIPNGNISITGDIYDLGAQDYIKGTIWLTTDNTGYYTTALAYDEPGGFDHGATLTIKYNPISGDAGVSKTLTLSGLGSWVNLTYERPVDFTSQIFSPTGLISIVVIISACFIGYYIYNSSKEEEEAVKESGRSVGRRRRK